MSDEQQPPAEGGTDYVVEGVPVQPAQRTSGSAIQQRFVEAREHVMSCPDEKELRDRTGECLNCGAIVHYGQTTCPHAVLVLGTCENCGTNYDRAGWTNKPVQEGEAAAPTSQEG